MKNLWSIAALVILAVCLPATLFAGGGQEVETEIFLSQSPQYISPGNPDSGHDVLNIENIQITIQDKAAIRKYELRIYNKRGEIIYSVIEENLEGRGFVGDLLNVGDIPSVAVPETMVWDGTDASGTVVADGEYFYQLYVRDSFNKLASTAPLSVVVDTVDPKVVNLSSDVLIFSPNGDGKRDTINFAIQTGTAASWNIEIQDASGSALLIESVEADGDTAATDVLAPSSFSWDGMINGSLAREADYQLVLRGTDRAGNVIESVAPFTLSNQAANIELSTAGDSMYFSRFVDSNVEFLVSVNETQGLQGWTMEVEDSEGIVYRRYSGTELPGTVAFDGKGNPGRPERGSVYLEDGTYRVIFSASYANGNLSKSDPFMLVIDSTAPSAGFAADSAPEPTELGNPLYFGGEAKPYLLLDPRFEEDAEWQFVLSDDDEGKISIPVYELLTNGIEFPYNWDGANPLTGEMLADGTYSMYLSAVDAAGNEGMSNVVRFIKDSQSRAATSVNLSSTVLAPGGDAGYEVVRIEPIVPVTEGIEYFILTVVNDEDGRPYFSKQVRQAINYVEWTGVRNNNTPVPDGSYHVELNIMYYNGDNPFAVSSESILVGRDRPEVAADVDRRLFTPNGDGDRDSINITQESSESDVWTGTFTNSKGEVVKTLTWDGMVESFEWDGTGESGEVLPDGFYTYTISSSNELGNVGSATLLNLRIDNLSATISIKADEEVFSPNGDGYKDVVTFLPEVAIPENLRAWEIRVQSADGLIRKSFQGGSTLPEAVVWDGENDVRTVEDAEYTVTFFVEYKNGNFTQREADDTVILVTNPPQGFVDTDLTLFSPDGDGINDVLTINLDARAADRPVESWEVEILDPRGNLFASWGGEGLPPETLIWDGMGSDGELVQSAADYTIVFSLEDNLRNRGIDTHIIPVDILVIAEGNSYRIRIPSIYFAGYTADLFAVSADEQDRNFDTLRRLASILEKYGEYSISIEGHAVSLLSGAAGATEQANVLMPLSLDRAEEVRRALAILGIDWDRMTTVGHGGADPVVPHSDLDNRWKNRRVEFILKR